MSHRRPDHVHSPDNQQRDGTTTVQHDNVKDFSTADVGATETILDLKHLAEECAWVIQVCIN